MSDIPSRCVTAYLQPWCRAVTAYVENDSTFIVTQPTNGLFEETGRTRESGWVFDTKEKRKERELVYEHECDIQDSQNQEYDELALHWDKLNLGYGEVDRVSTHGGEKHVVREGCREYKRGKREENSAEQELIKIVAP